MENLNQGLDLASRYTVEPGGGYHLHTVVCFAEHYGTQKRTTLLQFQLKAKHITQQALCMQFTLIKYSSCIYFYIYIEFLNSIVTHSTGIVNVCKIPKK